MVFIRALFHYAIYLSFRLVSIPQSGWCSFAPKQPSSTPPPRPFQSLNRDGVHSRLGLAEGFAVPVGFQSLNRDGVHSRAEENEMKKKLFKFQSLNRDGVHSRLVRAAQLCGAQ